MFFVVQKPVFWISSKISNQPAQLQRLARILIWQAKVLYSLESECLGPDQTAPLLLRVRVSRVKASIIL